MDSVDTAEESNMRLPSDLQAMLDAGGVPWRIEEAGGGRGRLMINDELAAVLPARWLDDEGAADRPKRRNILRRVERAIEYAKRGAEPQAPKQGATTILSGG